MTRFSFRDDPEWQEAYARYLCDDYGGRNPDEILGQRMIAAVDMHRIEARYEAMYAEPAGGRKETAR